MKPEEALKIIVAHRSTFTVRAVGVAEQRDQNPTKNIDGWRSHVSILTVGAALEKQSIRSEELFPTQADAMSWGYSAAANWLEVNSEPNN
jgi:hypothetical protein